jgi:hypothetical protein
MPSRVRVLTVSDADRVELAGRVRAKGSAARDVERARIVLLAAEGVPASRSRPGWAARSSDFAVPEWRLHTFASMLWSNLGDERRVVASQDAADDTRPATLPRFATHIELYRGLMLAKSGDKTGGLTRVQTALDRLPPNATACPFGSSPTRSSGLTDDQQRDRGPPHRRLRRPSQQPAPAERQGQVDQEGRSGATRRLLRDDRTRRRGTRPWTPNHQTKPTSSSNTSQDGTRPSGTSRVRRTNPRTRTRSPRWGCRS